MKRVIFSTGYLMYQAGETAAFAAAVSAELIAKGVAVDADLAEAKAKADAEAQAAAEAEAKAKAEAEKQASGKKAGG